MEFDNKHFSVEKPVDDQFEVYETEDYHNSQFELFEPENDGNDEFEQFEPDEDKLSDQGEKGPHNNSNNRKSTISSIANSKTHKISSHNHIDFETESESGTSGSEYVPDNSNSSTESDDSELSDSSHSGEKRCEISLSEQSNLSFGEESDISVDEKNDLDASLNKTTRMKKKMSIESAPKYHSISDPDISSDEDSISLKKKNSTNIVQAKTKRIVESYFSSDDEQLIDATNKTKNKCSLPEKPNDGAKQCKNSKKSLRVSKQKNCSNNLDEPLSNDKNVISASNTQKNNVRNESFDQSAEMSGFSSLENSFVNINLNSVGEALKNKNINVIPNSADGCKKNCCFYCVRKSIEENDKTIVVHKTKLPDHYLAKHSKEKAVEKLKELQKKLDNLKEKPQHESTVEKQELLKKRMKIFNLLRIKANHLNNLSTDDASKYVVRRRPHKNGKLLSSFLPCFHCTQVYSENSLRKHVRECTGLTFKKKHAVKSRARATNGAYHHKASESSIKIISKMRETKALEEIRFDTAVFVWLNAEASRCETKKHIHTKIRANLSRLGTLLMEIKKRNKNIEELCDIFHEDNYDDFIEAVKVMGKPNPDTAYMESPATANDMFNLIKHVCEIYEVTFGSKNETKRSEVLTFLRKLKTMWQYSIGTTIIETQARIRRNKAIDLPDGSDSLLLNNYLKNEMTDSFEKLEKSYSDHEYERLRNALCCYLQSTNARRPGEVERLEMEDYQNMKTSKTDCLIIPRGKRRRGVPIVFGLQDKRYLDILKTYRPKAGISEKNPYFFATIHDVGSTDFQYIRACSLMKKFSVSCQAKRPETLRGTRFRMKVATDGMEKGINQTEVQQLADYLGHTPRIHNQNYRQSVFDVDIAISRKVRAAQGLCSYENPNDSHAEGRSIVDHHEDCPSESYRANNEENCDTLEIDCNQSLPNHPAAFMGEIDKENVNANIENKGSSSIAKTRPLKIPWKQPQIDILLAHFPNALNLQYKVPSAKAINNFIANSDDPILQVRTEPQIRSWIHLKRKEKKSDDDLPERDRIPNYIYSFFKKHIEAGKTPSYSRCAKFLAQSPSKANITVSNLQEWVNMAIKKKSKVLSSNKKIA